MAQIDIGKLTFTHKGDYAGGTAYVANDVVYYNGSAYIAKTSTTGNLPTSTAHWNTFAAGSGGIWNAGLSLGSAGQVVKVNSGATALEFGTADSGKTLGITELVNSTRASLPNSSAQTIWNTSYTQIKANSKLKFDVILHGKQPGAGAINIRFKYDNNDYDGYIGYCYHGQNWQVFHAGSFMLNGSSTTGSKAIEVISRTQNGVQDRLFEIFNPNASDDARLPQTRSSIIITELDF